MPTQLDIRQSVLRSALNMAGTAANATVDTILPAHDANIGKLFEDRNILLTDGGTVTFTGTQAQFTENVNLVLNQKISGAVPQIISLGSASQNFTNNGDMWVAVINRTAGTATSSIITAGNALPAVSAANQEVFLIAKRIDAGDGTQRLYFRNGSAFNAGQTARLGSAGSGSGSGGSGDDLDSLQFAADFADSFTENAANANSSISTAFGTNATFNAAKSMYVISYDASKTVTTSGTTATMSSAPAYTVAVGDQLIVGLVAKKITAVASQTSYTLESAFATNLTAAACNVSQAVYTKDINNFAVDGSALSAAFPAAFSEIMVDYKDNAITNSNIFTPGTPGISWTGSPDNTNFTAVSSRSASELISQTSVILPSAGTSLYLRFFSNATSGSGTKNLITYKAYWQKSVTAAGTSNVLWSTFAMTNNSTTPINCTVSVLGGKTTITVTGNTYPVGLLPGQTIGALEVLLNGLSIDRFVSGSTPSTDAYYTELSPNVIQLDQDYSLQQFSISLVYSLQVIDSSSTNTSQLSALQNELSDGFQAYVSQSAFLTPTTTTGTPGSGTFYSTIPNRAPMIDLTQDLKPRMGIERIQVQQCYILQNEFGPNGEGVYAAQNDTFGQIRFIGNWQNTNGSSNSGGFPFTANVNDSVEITFYGTGLNILLYNDSASRSAFASVDGGTEGSTIYPASSGTAVIATRGYVSNAVCPVATGLTLGVHTVRVRHVSGINLNIFGYEVLNESTSVKTNPGVSYNGGNKLVTTAQSAIAYNSVVTGSRGGRVLVYQNANGTIGQAFNPAGSQLNMASADHTNEEVARTFYPREFGSDRGDDFSTLTTTGANRFFTLDDGTTNLYCQNYILAPASLVNTEGLGLATGAGDAVTFTFVGTGLDLTNVRGVTSATQYTVVVDGVTTQTATTTGGSGLNNIVKIVSGLPYGSHVVRLTCTGTSGAGFYIGKFIVYQPKKPTLPAGATELADYNVLATYVANSTATSTAIATGVIRKSTLREFVYNDGTGGQTAWTVSTVQPLAINGTETISSNLNAWAQYTFTGTGIEARFTVNTNCATSISVTINGLAATIANFPSLVTSVYGGGTFNTSTAILNNSTGSLNYAAGLQLSGLPFGTYTVRMNTNSAASANNFLDIPCWDIITPIHSYKANLTGSQQSTANIGSQAISDNRKLTPVKDALQSQKAWAQALASVSGPTTTSASFVPMPDMSVTLKTNGGALDISYSVSCFTNTGSGAGFFQVYVDGQPVAHERQSVMQVTGDTTLADRIIVPVSAGTHSVVLYWSINANTLFNEAQRRSLVVREM